VIFDRARAGGLLGGEGERSRSAPMLTLPVLITGGTQTMFEVRNPWQRAWAEYQTGASAIDYVPPGRLGLGIAAADIWPDRPPQPRVVERHPRPSSAPPTC
jgi:hypothetical protein